MTSLRIVLTGGPDQLHEGGCVKEVDNLDDKVKISFASGYEHFSHSGEVTEVDGDFLPVFHWCEKTRIAE